MKSKNSKNAVKSVKSKKSVKSTKQTKAAVVVSSASKGALGQILGHSVISVMRAMGRAGWSFETIQASVAAQKIEAAERTIRGAIRRGKAGEKRIAELTAAQLNSLKVEVEQQIAKAA